MRSNYGKVAVLAGALAVTAMLAGSAFAAETDSTQQCEALATRFKLADVSHMSAEKLESARRQANLGERLCKTDPKIGVKAIFLALKDIGDTAI